MKANALNRLCASLASVAFLAIVLVLLRDPLAAPSRLVPYFNNAPESFFGRFDQEMVISVVARTARNLLEDPFHLRGNNGCFPHPDAFTLGEHMVATSAVAALPYAITGSPIAAYNVAVVLYFWLPAVAMYAFALQLLRSPAAAFVSGALFAFQPSRLIAPAHLFVHGDLWAPLVLLFLHRLFVHGRWRDAAALALFGSLQAAESYYAVFGSAVVALAYGIHLLFRFRGQLRRVIPPLAAASAVVLATAWLLFRPYLAARSAWSSTGTDKAIALPLSEYMPPGLHSPGWLLLLLGGLGLADRLLRRRETEGEDPRWALTIAGLLLLWVAVQPIDVAGLVTVPSLYRWARSWIPGLADVRAVSAITSGTWLVLSLLAGYGVLRLIERRSRRFSVATAVALSVLLLLERFEPAVAHFAFPFPVSLDAREIYPPEEELSLIRRYARGPILHLPLPDPTGVARVRNASDLLLTTEHAGPTSACYYSIISPIERELWEISKKLPARSALTAFAALGFRTIVVDKTRYVRAAGLAARAAGPSSELHKLGESDRLAVYLLRPPAYPVGDFSLLESDVRADEVTPPASWPGSLRLRMRNGRMRPFRHPAPIVPTEVEVQWTRTSDLHVATETVKLLLPIAIAPGAERELELFLRGPPESGDYLVTVRRTVARKPLAAALVRVERTSTSGDPGRA